jgi:hypothetical protein
MEHDLDGSGPLLQGLCHLAQHVGEAEFTAIYVKKEAGVRVLASAGMALGALSEDWWIPMNPDNQPVVLVQNVRDEPLFADHPVHSIPGLKSMMMFPFRAPEPAGWGGLGLANMREASLSNFRVVGALSQISGLAAVALQANRGVAPAGEAGSHDHEGFQESFSAHGRMRELEPAGKFLFSTLVKRAAVRSRNGVGYLIVRGWRAAIKEHQLSALCALKIDPPSSLVLSVGEELTQAVRSVFGESHIENVVPVPCGNSECDECLSTRISANVATRLGARYVTSLKPQAGSGRSHPRKSARLSAYEVVRRPTGMTLVVDDVASSGRHLELAVRALRTRDMPVLAVAWIGS